MGRKGKVLLEEKISMEEGKSLPLGISPGRGEIGKRTPAKKIKKMNEKICKLNNYFEGTSPRPNLNLFTNVFACMDRAVPDRSVGLDRRTVIGQPMRDGIGRREEDQPGRAIEDQPRRTERRKKE